MSKLIIVEKIKKLLFVIFCSIFIIACTHTANVEDRTGKKSGPESNEISRNDEKYIDKNPLVEKNDPVPSYVYEILTYIRTHDKAPDTYLGGRIFQNREKVLPGRDNSGRRIIYREWDVHPKVKGKNRGPERLETSGLKAYYTKDHYKSFIFIKETY